MMMHAIWACELMIIALPAAKQRQADAVFGHIDAA